MNSEKKGLGRGVEHGSLSCGLTHRTAGRAGWSCSLALPLSIGAWKDRDPPQGAQMCVCPPCTGPHFQVFGCQASSPGFW